MHPIHTVAINHWNPNPSLDEAAELSVALESGQVLYFPELAFVFASEEQRFFDPLWSNGKDKNISLENESAALKGMQDSADEVAALRGVVQRFRTQAIGLIETLFPKYTPHLRKARTSYRPMPVEGRATSWRKDVAVACGCVSVAPKSWRMDFAGVCECQAVGCAACLACWRTV